MMAAPVLRCSRTRSASISIEPAKHARAMPPSTDRTRERRPPVGVDATSGGVVVERDEVVVDRVDRGAVHGDGPTMREDDRTVRRPSPFEHRDAPTVVEFLEEEPAELRIGGKPDAVVVELVLQSLQPPGGHRVLCHLGSVPTSLARLPRNHGRIAKPEELNARLRVVVRFERVFVRLPVVVMVPSDASLADDNSHAHRHP